MKTLVRQVAKVAVLAAFFAMSAVVVSAQSQGTVTINGSVNKAAAIRWWSFTPLNTETGANAPAPQNSPLNFTMNIGDVSPANLANYAGGTVQVILRTNAAYTLSAQVTASSGFGAVGSGDITLADVGYGLSGLAASGTGSLVTATAVSGSTFAGSFGNDPSTAGKDADGIPTYATTLNSIGASTQVLSGPRISKGGSVSSPNNGLLVNTHYTVAPQFFTPTGAFSATVTYTLATP